MGRSRREDLRRRRWPSEFPGQSEHAVRIGREGRAELDRLLEEAIQHLESMDLHGANEALKKAAIEAASLRKADPMLEFAGSSPSEARTRRGGRGATEVGGV